MTRLNWITLPIPLAMIGLAWWFYPSLPDPVPTHWNMAGEIDGWTPKPWGVWIFPALMVPMYAVLLVLPAVSPKGFRLEAGRRVYDIVLFALMAFMLAIQWVGYMNALDRGPNVAAMVPMMVGGLFIIIGNYLGKVPRNFFMGIRTPWTLASTEVWNRTHRLGGWMFMLAGVVMMASVFTGLSWPVFITATMLAAFVPTVYSLVLYRKLEGFQSEEE